MKPNITLRALSALFPAILVSLTSVPLALAQDAKFDIQVDGKEAKGDKKEFEIDGKKIEIDGTDITIDGKKFNSGGKTSQHSESRSESKSVSVTTVNGRTVRKTTVTRDGKEHTTTEVLDGDGNVIEGGDNDAQDPNDKAADDGPWMGVRVKEASSALRDQLDLGEDEGVVIDVIAPDGPAEKAGLRVNDILLKFEGSRLGNPDDLRNALAECEVGQVVTVETLRRGKKAEVKVTLEEKPEAEEGDAPPTDKGGNMNGGKAGARMKPGMLELEVGGAAGDAFDAMLNDKNVPEEFKKRLREMQERMRDFEKNHGKP